MKFVLAILSHTIRTRGTILIFQGDTELLETYLTYWGNAGCRFHFRQKWEHNGVPVLREDWDRNIIWCNIPILLGSWLDRIHKEAQTMYLMSSSSQTEEVFAICLGQHWDFPFPSQACVWLICSADIWLWSSSCVLGTCSVEIAECAVFS